MTQDTYDELMDDLHALDEQRRQLEAQVVCLKAQIDEAEAARNEIADRILAG
jgi:uncharacterized coiled-coil DUF342 family protein